MESAADWLYLFQRTELECLNKRRLKSIKSSSTSAFFKNVSAIAKRWQAHHLRISRWYAESAQLGISWSGSQRRGSTICKSSYYYLAVICLDHHGSAVTVNSRRIGQWRSVSDLVDLLVYNALHVKIKMSWLNHGSAFCSLIMLRSKKKSGTAQRLQTPFTRHTLVREPPLPISYVMIHALVQINVDNNDYRFYANIYNLYCFFLSHESSLQRSILCLVII